MKVKVSISIILFHSMLFCVAYASSVEDISNLLKTKKEQTQVGSVQFRSIIKNETDFDFLCYYEPTYSSTLKKRVRLAAQYVLVPARGTKIISLPAQQCWQRIKIYAFGKNFYQKYDPSRLEAVSLAHEKFMKNQKHQIDLESLDLFEHKHSQDGFCQNFSWRLYQGRESVHIKEVAPQLKLKRPTLDKLAYAV